MNHLLHEYWPALANMSDRDFWHGHLLRFSALRVDRLPPELICQMLLLRRLGNSLSFAAEIVGESLRPLVGFGLDDQTVREPRRTPVDGRHVFSREFLGSLESTAGSNELLLKSDSRPFHNCNVKADFLMVPISRTGAAVDYVMCLFTRLTVTERESALDRRRPTIGPCRGTNRRDH